MDAAIRDALRALAGAQLTVPIDSVLSFEQVNDAFGPISQCSACGKMGLDTTAWDALRSAGYSQWKARTGTQASNLARSGKGWNIPNGRRCLHEPATAGKRGLPFKIWPCSPARNAA